VVSAVGGIHRSVRCVLLDYQPDKYEGNQYSFYNIKL